MALGLSRGLTGADLLDLYLRRGTEIFPRPRNAVLARMAGWWNPKWQFVTHLYDSEALRKVLVDLLGERLYGDSKLRLCIPSFDGKNSEVFVYKTPHHKDYTIDRFKPMVDVGMSTSAAPTFFKPHQTDGYVLVDGGVWANNPIMIGLVEALTSFDVGRDQIEILSIGCGDERYTVGKWQLNLGGNFAWAKIILAAMRLQSLAATNQARLLLGPPSVVRIDPPTYKPSIGMDDHTRAVALLPAAAEAALDNIGFRIADMFLTVPADPYVPEALPAETTA